MASPYDPLKMADAIRESHGMLSIAARRVGCSLATVYRHRDKFAVVRQAIEESRELMTDTAESALFDAIRAGQPWAVQFYLKTIGKNRGYVERQERVELSDDDITRLLEAEIAKLPAQAAGSGHIL